VLEVSSPLGPVAFLLDLPHSLHRTFIRDFSFVLSQSLELEGSQSAEEQPFLPPEVSEPKVGG
jgi:hypothetical protein